MEEIKMITNEQKKTCKDQLIQRQFKLIQQVQDHFGMEMSHTASVGELSTYDNHPADMGTELFERGKDNALNEHAEEELKQINEALHAIEEDTYGICSVCGVDIPFERLEAVPTTDRCINHADDQAFTRDHPVEEEVFSPSITSGREGDDHVGYDAEDAWQDVARYGTSDTPSDFSENHDDYNHMYINSHERIGATEAVEEVLMANMEGKYTGFSLEDNEEEDHL